MKTMKLLFTLLFVAGFAAVGSGQTIVGSAHDLSGASWNTSDSSQICIVCHTPHNAMSIGSMASAVLWNHDTSTTAYQTYTSTTLTGTFTDISGVSKLCLSCHDGTISLADFGGATGGAGNRITGTGLLGTDLRNDHPVSISYDVADLGLNALATSVTGAGTDVSTVSDLLFSGNVECASCHDVHNGNGIASLLRKDNTGSEFCLDCHNK